MASKNDKKARPDAGPGRRAVVDIGSNSVRLVVYEGPARAPLAICNEKALCGLGRDVADDGSLNPESVANALAILKRFRLLLRAFDEPPVQAIATAAVREAKDGEAFVEAVHKLGYDVSVISGEEEAGLAALGVASTVPGAKGVVGDMGGGSLELVVLKNGATRDSVSLPIGPLSVMHAVGEDHAKAEELIAAEIGKVKFLSGRKPQTLYAVGGAWRSLARIQMNLKHYPLSVLHHYELTRASAIEVCDLVARQSRRSLEEVPGISRKRIDTLPYAAMALKSLLNAMRADRMVVSAGGVREGLLFRDLASEARKEDPLLAAAQFFAGRYAPNPAFSAAALSAVAPLFRDGSGVAPRILKATATLVDIAAYLHPDLRGKQAFDTALSAPFWGLSHADHVWIALALYCRYRGRNTPPPNERALGILDWEAQQSATQAGLAFRFVSSLAPKSPQLLEGCRLEMTNDGLMFAAPADYEDLMGETPRKRLDALAAAYDTQAVLKFGA